VTHGHEFRETRTEIKCGLSEPTDKAVFELFFNYLYQRAKDMCSDVKVGPDTPVDV
jgi:hypothetical protein